MAAVSAFYGVIAFHNYIYIWIYIQVFIYGFLIVFLYGSSLEVFPYGFLHGFPKWLKLEGSPIWFSFGFPFIFFDYLLRVSATTIHYFNAIMAVLMFVSAIVICCFVLSAVLLY